MSMMVSFVLSFFPRDVLYEILNLIESVSEDFLTTLLEVIQKKFKKVATYRQILNKPIYGLLSFLEFGPIYRSYLENKRRLRHGGHLELPIITHFNLILSIHHMNA